MSDDFKYVQSTKIRIIMLINEIDEDGGIENEVNGW